MVTGDQYAIAVETSRRLGLGTNIMEGKELLSSKATNLEFAKHVEAMDGFAGVVPEHKHRIVEAVQFSGRLVGMTGQLFLLLHISYIKNYNGRAEGARGLRRGGGSA